MRSAKNRVAHTNNHRLIVKPLATRSRGRQADTARPIKASLKRKRKLQVKWQSATGNEAHKCPKKSAARGLLPHSLGHRKLTRVPRLTLGSPLLWMWFWWIIKRMSNAEASPFSSSRHWLVSDQGNVCQSLLGGFLDSAASGLRLAFPLVFGLLPEWALKWTPQWMCAAWQIRKVSFEIKQHLLPILNYISAAQTLSSPRPLPSSFSPDFLLCVG